MGCYMNAREAADSRRPLVLSYNAPSKNSLIKLRNADVVRYEPHGSSKFKGSTFNDQTPFPIVRITSCSEACAGWIFLLH